MDTQAKANKILTPEYLEWEAKLTELPGILTDKIRSRLYKRYKNKTRFDPWIKFENLELPQIKKTDNCILQDSSLETQIMAPNKNYLYQYTIEHGINF